MKKALMLASVASMIEQFNMPNIKLLQELGYEVHVACNFEVGNNLSIQRIKEFKKELTDLKIKIYQIPIPRNIRSVWNIVQSYHQVKELVEKNQYDIVHCHSPIGGVIARLACKKVREKGTRVIYTAHGFHFYKGAPIMNWIVFYPIEKWLARYTDVLITINKEDANVAQKLPAKEIEYITGVGIHTENIARIMVDKRSKREELGIPLDAKVLVSVGELNLNKNHATAIRAVSQVEHPNLYYVVCGQGQLRDELIQLSQELGIADKIKFLGFRKDVIEIMKASDIFVFPSRREGLSVALMEAMAAGLPIISSKIRGNTDLISPNEGGYLVHSMETEGYTESIKKLISNQELCNKISEHNANYIKEYDIKKVNEHMRKVYGGNPDNR